MVFITFSTKFYLSHVIPPINIFIPSIYINILSDFANVVNYDTDNGWTTIFDKFKKEIPEISEETKTFFDKINNGLNISNCQDYDKLFEKFNIADESLKNFLKTWDGTGDISEQYQQHLQKASSSTTKFASVLQSIGAVAANMIAMLVISKVISGIYELSQVSKNVAKSAKELGSSFNDAKSDIADYKSKISELYDTINNSSSSVEDVTNARKSLISIQGELIDKFGTEKDIIDDVTDAINGQTDALDRLTNAKWQKTKNEFNNGDFWNDAANFFQGTDNIERMLDEYGEKTISFKWADFADINKFTDEMVAKLENIGIDIKVSTDNLQAVRDFDSLTESITNTKGASLAFTGNAEEIYNKLLALQNLIGNDDSFGKLYDKVESTANSYKDLTDSYKDFYNQYILQEKILSDGSDYADTFKDITDAYEKYNKAFTSGNEEDIKKTSDEYASLLLTAMDTAITNGDSDIATYFEGMYPELQSVVTGWKFNLAFDTNTDDLQGKVQTVLDELKDKDGRALTAEEILGLGEANKQYQDLITIASTYNMSIAEMIELLKERNLVSAMDYQGLVGLFGQDNIDKLSPADLEIAYTIKNVGNMTFKQLQAELQKTTYNLSSSIGSLETYQSTLESITNSYSALQTVQSEQNSQNYITKESYDALIEANSDFANCLEYGNGHMQINTEKANAMAKANSELALAELEVKEALEVEQYNKNWQAIQELISGKASLTQEEQEQFEALKSENAQIEENVRQYDLIESQIKQATSAYNEWQAAMNGSEKGDMYDSIVSNLDKVKELYDQGLTGTNAFKAATTALFGEDFNLDNFGTYFENIKRYFSEGSQGAQNFVDDLVKIGQLQIDNDGNYFGDVDWSKVQKELNLTYDDLQAIFGKLNDYDFNIDTTNGIDGINDLTEAQNDLNSSIDEYRKKINNKKNAGLDTTQDEEKLKSLESELEAVNTKLEDTVTNAENVSSTPVKLDIDAELGKLDLSNLSAEAQETLNQLNATNEQIKFNAQIGVDNTYLEQQAQLQLNLLKEQLKVPVETDTKKSEKSISELGTTADIAKVKLENVQTGLINIKNTNVGTAGLTGLNTQLDNANSKADKLKNTLMNLPSDTGGNKKGNSKSGKTELNGTTGGFAHANGTAFVNGSDISAKESSWALTGELGRELVVRGNRWFTTGDNGAEFTHIKKGDIVFNAAQTRQLLDGSGKINSRGKAFVNGTAYDIGTNTSTVKGKFKGGTSSTTKSNSKSNSKDKDKDKKSSKTLIDWIERRITVLTQKAERWANIIENATNPKRLDSYYQKLEANYKKQVKTYSNGAARYLQKANSIKLDSSLKNKVKSKDSSIFNKNGSMKSYKTLIKEYGENTAKKIQDYQNYIDKYESALDSFIEATQKLYQAPIEKAADKIELLSKSLDLLDAKLENISIDDYQLANSNLAEQTKNVEAQLNANREAEKEANKNFNSVKSTVTKKSNLQANDLAGKKSKREASKKSIQKAVANGEEIDLSLYKAGSSGYKAAVKYNAALKAQKEATDAAALSQEEYTKTVRENAKAQFDNIQTYYESRIKLLDHQFTSIDNKISEIETAGKNVNKSYYEDQKKLNQEKKDLYEEEKAKLEEQIATIPQGTDEWYDAKDAIQECTNAISDCVKESYNLNKAINELHFQMFNDTAKAIDRIITEQEFLQDLFAHENLTDDKTGDFTNAGLAKLGSLSASYYAAKEKAERDAALLKDLQNVKENGKLSDDKYKLGDWEFDSLNELQAKIDEVYTQWQDDIKETYNLESNIADLMKEKYQAELDMLQELIDAKKEALDAERDLHDYQQSIQEKTKDIATIKKQIAAYSGDSSQEGLAKLQKLQVQLSEKESDLRETEFDRYLSDSESMLDKLYQEYEELMTKKLDDFMALVQEGLTTANNNTSTISDYLSKVATDNGYTEETKGLFSTISGNISDSTKSIVTAIADQVKENSGTVQETQNASNANPPASGIPTSPSPSALPTIDSIKTTPEVKVLTSSAPMTKTDVVNFIKKNGTAPEANKTYNKVNTALKKKYSKVLSGDKQKELAKALGISNNSDKIYDKLKSLKVPGFKKGGIVSVQDLESQVQANGDKVLVSANPGEGILTPVQTEILQKLADVSPQLNMATDNMLSNIAKIPDISNVKPMENHTTIGDMVFQIDMPNVTNPDEFVTTLQTNQKMQKAIRSVSTERLAGNGKLNVNKII